MAVKTYRTHRLNLSVQWEKPTGVGDKTRNVALSFAPLGTLQTDDEETQKYIESLPSFNMNPDKADIWIDSPAEKLAAATAKAAALRDVANKAVAEAEAAESIVKALTPAAAPSVQ